MFYFQNRYIIWPLFFSSLTTTCVQPPLLFTWTTVISLTAFPCFYLCCPSACFSRAARVILLTPKLDHAADQVFVQTLQWLPLNKLNPKSLQWSSMSTWSATPNSPNLPPAVPIFHAFLPHLLPQCSSNLPNRFLP